VDAGWVPYSEGYWTNDYPYGPTWVSSEPWGYAPYHYGRWANVGNQWYWVPDGVNTTPAYAPALVAFVPLDDANQIGWVPLAPGDPYAPRYYDANWQPQYLTRTSIAPAQLINLGIPGAVTVVPVDSFGRSVDRRNLRRIDQQRLASVRSTLDPLTLTPLRNAVIHSAWGRGKIDLPPGIAKKLDDTPVFVGRDLRESRFRKDLAKSMRVEKVSGKDKDRKFKVRDANSDSTRAGDHDRREESQALDQQRKQEIDRLNAEAKAEAREGNREARRQTRALEQQQRRDSRAQAEATRRQVQSARAEIKATRAQNPIRQQQPQGQRVANPAKHEARRESPRPQMRPQPRPQMQSAQPNKHEMKQQSQGAPKHGPPANPGG